MKHLVSLSLLVFAALLACGAVRLVLPPVPSSLQTPSERADFITAHFWDSIDFKSRQGADTAVIAQYMADFIDVLPLCSGDSSRIAAIDAVAQKASATDSSAMLFSALSEQYLFSSDSPQRNEPLYIDFLEAMLRTHAYADSTRTSWLLDATAKNMPGTGAADFEFNLRDGSVSSLASLRGTPVVLLFYDPECEHCHHAIAALSDDFFLKMRIEQERVKVLAVIIGTDEDWTNLPAVVPSSWIDAADFGAIDEGELYYFGSMPSMYVIDADGNVVLKDGSTAEVLSEVLKF